MESGLLLDAKLPAGFKLDAQTKYNQDARDIADKYAKSKGLAPLSHDIKPEFAHKYAEGGETSEKRPQKVAIADLHQDNIGKDKAEYNLENEPQHKSKQTGKPVQVGLNVNTGKLHLLDGYHRVAAATKAGDAHVDAEVQPSKCDYHKPPSNWDEIYQHKPAKWKDVKKPQKFADGGMAMPAGFSLDATQNAIPESTPQSLTGQPADQTPQSNGLPPGFQLDEDRYSGAGQTAQAAVEGALGPLAGPGQSLPGTGGMLKSGLGIGSNEAIRQRAEAHPYAHTAGELGQLMVGPEGAGLETFGKAAAEAAGVAAPATYAARVGSAAVKNAAEFAAYNGFDQVTKSIQDDPNVGAESFLANVGLGAALGGGIGLVGAGMISPLWKATMGSELAGQMKAIVSHFGGTEASAAKQTEPGLVHNEVHPS